MVTVFSLVANLVSREMSVKLAETRFEFCHDSNDRFYGGRSRWVNVPNTETGAAEPQTLALPQMKDRKAE